MKTLHHGTLKECIAHCCANASGPEKAIRRRGIELLHDELRQRPMLMGCTAREAERHLRDAQEKAQERLLCESEDPACEFGIIEAVTILGFLVQLWRLFWEWRRSKEGPYYESKTTVV